MKKTRNATFDDSAELSILFDEYRVFYHKESDVNSAENFLKERLQNKDSEIYVAETDGKLVGFVQLYPLFSSTRMKKYWLLNELYVNVNSRGKGFSKELIDEAKKWNCETCYRSWPSRKAQTSICRPAPPPRARRPGSRRRRRHSPWWPRRRRSPAPPRW